MVIISSLGMEWKGKKPYHFSEGTWEKPYKTHSNGNFTTGTEYAVAMSLTRKYFSNYSVAIRLYDSYYSPNSQFNKCTEFASLSTRMQNRDVDFTAFVFDRDSGEERVYDVSVKTHRNPQEYGAFSLEVNLVNTRNNEVVDGNIKRYKERKVKGFFTDLEYTPTYLSSNVIGTNVYTIEHEYLLEHTKVAEELDNLSKLSWRQEEYNRSLGRTYDSSKLFNLNLEFLDILKFVKTPMPTNWIKEVERLNKKYTKEKGTYYHLTEEV